MPNHDEFFKLLLNSKENIVDFVQYYLPKEVLSIIDLNSIEIAKDSFIEQELKEHYSDLLYTVNIKGKHSYIYTLYEHKSHSEQFTALQLLKYMVKIWYLHLEQNEKVEKLPIILPIVFYHGKEKWKFGSNLQTIVEEEEVLKQYIPDYNYYLLDLSNYTNEEIVGNAFIKVGFYLLKNIFNEDSEVLVQRTFELLKELRDKTTGLRFLEAVIRYILINVKDIKIDNITKIAKNVRIEEVLHTMPTIAEELILEGFIKGEQTGIEKGIEKGKKLAERRARFKAYKEKLRMAIDMKKRGLDIDFILNVIKGIDSNRLERFLKRRG